MTKPKQSSIILTITLTLISLVIAAILLISGRFAKTNIDQQRGPSINLNPPTEQEKQSGDDIKKTLGTPSQNDSSDNSSNNSSTRRVDVLITDAGQYDDIIEVRAFVPSYFQDGICTITLSQGTNTIQKTTPAYRDSSSTVCTNPKISRNEITTPGNWQVVVNYSAPGALGTSQTQTINIQ